MRGDKYQLTLIGLGVVVSGMFSAFLYKELFPEYKIYQKGYVALEEFRSEITKEPPPPFEMGVKQIVIDSGAGKSQDVDRCTSCHVAMQYSHFSPTKLGLDINGNLIVDDLGVPLQVPNDAYIFTKLDEAIKNHPEEADRLKALRFVKWGDKTIDLAKVLVAHPLIGRETRPFEYHPIDQYGCTSCHNGNGRGLVADKAHGPVFDGEYEAEFMGPKREFLEKDPEHDPKFAHVFNDKPDHKLLFQTTPLFVGGLIEAKCMACHQGDVGTPEKAKEALQTGFEHDNQALKTLMAVQKKVELEGVDGTLKAFEALIKDPSLTPDELRSLQGQIAFLKGKEAPLRLSQEIQRIHASKKKENLDALLNKTAANYNTLSDLTSEISRLTFHFNLGKDLFVSQGCYACHRIEGNYRGGVGPELTMEGNSYPWFIKESIVWPQADLKTSTMPNFKLDHEELEGLVTYLLAQKGRPESVSEVEWKKKIVLWEGGERTALEQAVPPTKIRDVSYGMTVFATEGCAACHRLKGFESNTGFDPKQEEVARTWFRKNFPEEIRGSLLVKAIESQKEEIDRHILSDVRKGALLDELEANNPGLLESFYSNFKYALRALSNDDARVRKVLLAYIQEYGLGRLIGPRPNWSGIYRSDEWLMGHFKKPSLHTARSIMPVFPFDESKFWALTYMLNVVGKKNLEALKTRWKEFGFNPEEAYLTLCSQCHGESLHGNGPVSEWIYPIPKNLRNADFLRNYTKENVKYSIKHGIKGTPMPPWGETALDKPFENTIPVLSAGEILQLTDWIFSSLAGGTVIRGAEDLPKWRYSPEDVLKEIERSGEHLKKGEPAKELHLYEMEPSYQGARVLFEDVLFASLKPEAAPSVLEVFNVAPNPEPSLDKNLYYIKRKYYTEENLQAGKDFFQANCSVCHGRDADGLGYRAGTMYDAKPRMLTNLPWLEMRDDLRLLRSIKYGVNGTSMTPWGDQTTSLQRMQLVMYIRSLSLEQNQRESLTKTLYQTFDASEQAIEEARGLEFVAIDKANTELESVEKGLQSQKGDDELLLLFKKQLLLKKELEEHKNGDDKLILLKEKVKKEKELFNILGVQLVGYNLGPKVWQEFLNSIAPPPRFSFKEGKLKMEERDNHKSEKELLHAIEVLIQEKKRQLVRLEGKIFGPEIRDEESKIKSAVQGLEKIYAQAAATFKEALHLRLEQEEIYKKTGTP